MSVSEASRPPPPAPARPGLWGHLGRIALLGSAVLAGSLAGALAKGLVERTASPLSAAVDFADDVSEPLLAIVWLAAASAVLRAALGDGMKRRRRLVSLRRAILSWLRFAPLIWIPVLVFIVFAEGWMLLIALAGPVIVYGLARAGAWLAETALTAGPLTYAAWAVGGLAIGLFA